MMTQRAIRPTQGLRFGDGRRRRPFRPGAGMENLERRALMAGFLNEFPLPPPQVPADPSAIFSGPDGNLWFEEVASNQIGKITPAGAITLIPKPAGAPDFSGGFTTGPDGNLWFPEVTFQGTPAGKYTLYDTVNGTIGRVTPSGVVTQFPLPTTRGAAPSKLTVGPDGNLWFTEAPDAGSQTQKYAVGRITPAGVITEFPLPDQSYTSGIAVGPDGNLWFGNGGNVGRITPAGAITQFPVPGFRPTDVIAAPDGNLWFSDAFGFQTGRITTAGVVTKFPIPSGQLLVGPDGNLWSGTERIALDGTATTFPLPTPGLGVSSLTNGPDGNLWFVETTDNVGKVGRITLAGVVTEFPLNPTTDKFSSTITTGPDGNLWIAEGSNGRLARITTSGVLTEFSIGRVIAPAVPSVPEAITAGPDGALWYTEGHGLVGRITTAGVGTEYPLPLRDQRLNGIAAGSDGNLWFTENYDQIGRITPSGTITEFPITPGAGALGIAAGPDGNLWFIESLLYKIGRITPAGVVTEFAAPRSGLGRSIAAGPDGNLWFSSEPNNVVRITTSGVVTEFPFPTTDRAPVDFTAGPDGNVWFTETGGRVGRVTPTGTITEFATPTASAAPTASLLGAITAGSDGNLWFLYQDAAKIGRITTAGVVTEFAAPEASSYRHGITTGSDGNLWFTESHKIAQIVPAALLVPLPLSGGLDPASDGGASHSDGITSVNRPSFVGATAPGATVRVFAQRSDQSTPVLLGQTVADSAGLWSVMSAPLADGSYAVTATASDALGRTGAASLSPLTIATVGPKVAGLSVTPKTGVIAIAFQGGLAGLDPTGLLDPTNYVLVRRACRRLVRLAVTKVTVSGPIGAETVVLTIAGGRRLRPATYTLTIASGGVADRAGNPLNGLFTGSFPSGGTGHGGVFAANLVIVGNHALKPRPVPAPKPRRRFRH